MQIKVIPRIQGGMGNQLFSYAAARRLALVNGAELVIDDRSGFVRDHNYRRSYQLERFRIPCRKASAAELLAPFPRIRRYLKQISTAAVRSMNVVTFSRRGMTSTRACWA